MGPASTPCPLKSNDVLRILPLCAESVVTLTGRSDIGRDIRDITGKYSVSGPA